MASKRSHDLAFKRMALDLAKIKGNRPAAKQFRVDEKRIREWRQQEAAGKFADLDAKIGPDKAAKRRRLPGGGRKATNEDTEIERMMEVCVDSLESALEAYIGGATRLELCQALSCGGLTPSVGLVRAVKSAVDIPVFVMLRPRSGDFVYSKADLEVMTTDASVLKESGADGFVFGALLEDGSIDAEFCKELVAVCSPLPVTFHRAIDSSKHPVDNIPQLIQLGFDRVLTSGGKATALEGCHVIQEMVEKYGDQIVVMPGAGITASNLKEILHKTGAKEFHGSASSKKKSTMTFVNLSVAVGSESDYLRNVCNSDNVSQMVDIYSSFCKERKLNK